jgi:hypothetical protein
MGKSTAFHAGKVYTHQMGSAQAVATQGTSLTLILISVSLVPQLAQAVSDFMKQTVCPAVTLLFHWTAAIV